MRFRSIVCLAAVVALGFGCGKKADKDDKKSKSDGDRGATAQPIGDDTKAAVSTEPAPLDVNPDEAVWNAFPIGDTGVVVEAVDGYDVKDGEMNTSRYFRQVYGPAALAVWYGDGSTIERWRSGFTNRKDVTLTEPKKVKVCGVEGEMQEATLPARGGGKVRESIPLGNGNTVADEATGAAREKRMPSEGTSGGGTMGVARGRPEAVVIVLAFDHKKSPVIASYRVPTGHREKLAKIEKHFFESISCG